METSFSMKIFDTGVSYEAARECINHEIARHHAAIDEISDEQDVRVRCRGLRGPARAAEKG